MNNNFDIHIIVNLNGGEIIDHDYLGNPIWSMNPKQSHEAASDPNYQMYYNYSWLRDIVGDRRDITKQEWKRAYSAYRNYHHQ